MIESVETPDAPLPAGHYAQATVWKDLVFISGQLPIHPVTKENLTGPIEAQTRQVLENVRAIAEAAGSDLSHILKTTVYIADISLWDRVNAVYADFFGDHKPARAVVPTKELHYGFLIEIEAVAVRREA
ncbi:RidA family protein [Larkinella soli]|uniref:RidA family protein n=1 Tax=Larkinella soli TaxID=1770527 RepID=UPI001E60E0F1|nr:Rid family detoxifying hydrolase [Larkinella soli]